MELYEALRPLLDTYHAERGQGPAAEERDAVAAAPRRGGKRQSFAGWGGGEEGPGQRDGGGGGQGAGSDGDATGAASSVAAGAGAATAPALVDASPGILGVDVPIKLAIVGLPNAGKSTLLNTLLGRTRAITGPEPGLTRDAVTAEFAWEGARFELVDTAGWMRRATLGRFDDVGGRVAGLTVLQVRLLAGRARCARVCSKRRASL